MKFLTLIFAIMIFPQSFAATCMNRGPNVVLFTWDGIRNQEFFDGTDYYHRRLLPFSQRGKIMKKFWSSHAKEGVVLGEDENYRIASSVAISLPSYQAIFSGHATDCRNNSCGLIKEETFLENIRQKLKLPVSDVAAFASWQGLQSAVALDSSKITRAVYPEIREDSLFDQSMIDIQKKAMTDLPQWSESRKDEYTFQLAMNYLKKNCPRVMYVSLVDSDENGHANDYPGYVRTMKRYDEYLDELITTLAEMGEYGKQTTLIVTTDHSRGEKEDWTRHGYTDQVNKEVFLYLRGHGVTPTRNRHLGGNHSMIRNTIESLMGVPNSGPLLPGVSLTGSDSK